MRPLTTRSVLLSTLLGTHPPVMPVAALVRAGALFGISEGSVRTSLTRMVARGELETEAGRYRLFGALVDRQRLQDVSRQDPRQPWTGRWVLAVITSSEQSSADRSQLRSVLQRRFVEQRPGVWARPENLSRDDLGWSALDEHCVRWFAHPDRDDAALAADLWDLESWSVEALRLRRGLADWQSALDADDPSALRPGFEISAAVLRHLVRDPLLPDDLLPRGWGGPALRGDYQRFDESYQRVIRTWLRAEADQLAPERADRARLQR